MLRAVALACMLGGATAVHAQGRLAQIVPEPEAAPATELPSPEAEEAVPAPPRAMVTPPLWRVGVAFGTAWVNGKALRSVFQSGALGVETLDVDWQPSAFGLRLGASGTAGDERYNELSSHYDAEDLHLEGIYSVLGSASSAELLLFAGAMRAWHRVSLDDGDVTLTGTGADYGPLFGFDLGSQPFYGLSLLLRGYVSEQRVDLSTFGFRHYLVERALMIGGSYAF